MTRPRLTILLVAAALAGCGPSDTVPGATASSGSSAPDSGAMSGTTSQSPFVDSAALRDTSVLVALDGEGVRLVLASTGSTRLLAFGMEADGVIHALTVALARPTSRGANAECGAGPMEFAVFGGGLSINIQKGRFVGWSARGSDDASALTTMGGVGVGSTRAALDSVYVARVFTSTLGEEFAAGGLAGVLDGTGAGARITNLWAGMNCLAR